MLIFIKLRFFLHLSCLPVEGMNVERLKCKKMARQKGIIKLLGTVGDITFYKAKEGFLAREKGGVDKSRIMNDPNFQRTRENGEEFGRAGASGKMLRTAFRAVLLNSADSRMVGRLTRDMVKVIQADMVSERGKRNVINGDLALLKGFDFNINGKLSTTIYAPYTTTLDRAEGDVLVDIPAFVPVNMINAPSGTTHFKIEAAAADVNFNDGSFNVSNADTGILPYDAVETTAISLATTLPANSTEPIFLVLGVEFYQEINGEKYVLKNGVYNALQLIEVNKA